MSTYLFDFDGTLVDSMPTYVCAVLRVLDENNIKYENDIVKKITPLGFGGTARYYREELGLDMPQSDIVASMHKNALDGYLYSVPAKPCVIETLKALRAQGDDLNVLTASPHATLDPCLKRLGIYGLFTNVWSCEDFGTTKADPDIYVAAAERMGVAVGDVLFVDDNLGADKTAKSAGMKVCGIYDDSSREYVEEMKAETDFYVFNFADIAEI